MTNTSTLHILRDQGERTLSLTKLPIERLRLDPNNVRFRHLSEPVLITDAKAEEILWQDRDTKTLFQEILTAGGISEPLYVRRNDDHYMVKEGNRRLTCLRHAVREARAGNLDGFSTEDFEEVSAFVLDEAITLEEEAILEARWHVMGAGKKQWPAFNQSAHIWSMHHKLGMPIAKISDALGMSRPTVYKRLRAYEAMVEYQAQTADPDLRKFSYFDEAYRAPDTAKWLGSDESHLHDLIDWVYQGKFNRNFARDMRDLTKVLEDKPARDVFLRKDFESAFNAYSKGNPEVQSETFKLVKDATDALRNIPRKEMLEISTDSKRREMLEDLINEAQSLLSSST